MNEYFNQVFKKIDNKMGNYFNAFSFHTEVRWLHKSEALIRFYLRHKIIKDNI